MTQLTQERFEQILTEKLAPLATKEDVHREVREGVEELARMVSTGFEDVQRRLDVVERVQRLETDMHKIKEALHITA